MQSRAKTTNTATMLFYCETPGLSHLVTIARGITDTDVIAYAPGGNPENWTSFFAEGSDISPEIRRVAIEKINTHLLLNFLRIQM